MSDVQSQLPPGPWAYRPDKYDDWGTVRDADGCSVAHTCPPGVGQVFSEANPAWDDVRKAGPPQARAVAELLIRAEREADPTPVDEAWFESIGAQWVPRGRDDESATIVLTLEPMRWFQFTGHGMVACEGEDSYAFTTRGQVRTAARLFGIQLKEGGAK